MLFETKCYIEELFKRRGESSQDESRLEVDPEPQVSSSEDISEDQRYNTEPAFFSREISEAFYFAYCGADCTTRETIQTWTIFHLCLRNEDLDQSHIGVSLSQALRDVLLRFPNLEPDAQINVFALIRRILPNIEAELLAVLQGFMD